MMERDSSMVQIFLIGLGAGIAAAFLFVSIASGAVISLVLFHFAPLPILIAALGWSHWAGLIALLVAVTGIAATSDNYLFLAFLLGIGLPAWWLGYLTLLARPVASPAGTKLEWYPIGRLVVWAAIVSAFVIVAMLFNLGTTEDSLRSALRRGIELMLRQQDAAIEVPDLPDVNRWIEAFLVLGLPIGAVLITFINLFLLWLAGHIVNVSGRLQRPWPELSAMAFPAITPALLAAAFAGLLLTGLTGIISSVFAASLATAYAVLGFAVLHAITRGMITRGLSLACVYFLVLFVPPTLVMIALLGLADTAFNIRDRIGAKRSPPSLRT
jgi:hypothetical protein